MKILFLICILIMGAIVTCNAQSKSDAPRQLQEGVYLKDGGQIDSLHTRGILVKVERNIDGLKHLFISDNGDSLYVTIRFKRLELNKCYKVPLPKSK